MQTKYITVLLSWRDVKAQKCRNDQPRDVNQSLEPQNVKGKHPAMHVLRYNFHKIKNHNVKIEILHLKCNCNYHCVEN